MVPIVAMEADTRPYSEKAPFAVFFAVVALVLTYENVKTSIARRKLNESLKGQPSAEG